MKKQIALALLVLFGVLTSCNLFEAIDGPGGRAQLLSRARACLDRLDFTCAAENYGKLGSPDDSKTSELIYLSLAQNGLLMEDFIAAFSGGGSGQALTTLANALIPATETTRRTFFLDFKSADEIVDADTKAFSQFMAAIAFTSAILAESATTGDASVFDTSDVAATPTTCNGLTFPATCNNAACDEAVGNVLGAGAAITLSASIEANVSGTPTLGMLHGGIEAIDNAMTALSASGSFGTGIGGFTDAITVFAGETNVSNGRCYRMGLLQNGIGSSL